MSIKKSRSIYCTDFEYERLKVALDTIRLYDRFGSRFFPFDSVNSPTVSADILMLVKNLEDILNGANHD